MENQVKTNSLQGKHIIILGASSGIGFATAKAAAHEGAQVTIVSSNQSRIDIAIKELPEDAKGYAVDLSKEQNIKDFFEQVSHFDHLVYTAGENLALSHLKDTDLAWASNFFNVRYWGALAAVKYGAPKINQDGSICLTGGIAGTRPGAGWSVAASICGAMEGFTRAMAIELAPVRVNLVAPGVVKTNLWSAMTDSERENLYQSVGNSLPVKRVGEAEDIAQAYLYLMQQTYTTGQTMFIDGGNVLV
jgi:NAD(P)-dependent dehydrogenase (short-subunit alcohol dehydrogenase family)